MLTSAKITSKHAADLANGNPIDVNGKPIQPEAIKVRNNLASMQSCNAPGMLDRAYRIRHAD